MNTYFPFLRGMNMAVNKIIKIKDLRNCFESMQLAVPPGHVPTKQEENE
jgi:uncharacterized protein (DUF1697 family)